jgi:hypothetical protein
MSWADEKKWSDKFLREIKRCLGEFLVGEPAVEEDQERNTDLIVLKMEPVRIACRVRRYSYFENPVYRDQFTMRRALISGYRTELSKVMEGWGDYMFYGFANSDQTTLQAWRILSLNAFRLWMNQQLFKSEKGKMPGEHKDNRDGSTSFTAFNVKDIPNLVFAERGFSGVPAEWDVLDVVSSSRAD